MHIILGYAFDGGSFPDALGEAVHGFLVQDNPEQCLEIRMAQALAICTRWDVTGIAPGDLVAASDRLIAYLRDTYGEGTALKERPMHMCVGNQVASGWIDDWEIEVEPGMLIQNTCSMFKPMALASFSREALRSFFSPLSIWDKAACVMPARAATSLWVIRRYSRQARTIGMFFSTCRSTTSWGIASPSGMRGF